MFIGKQAMDQPKIQRLLRLMRMLQGNVNLSVEEIAQRLNTSTRTIYRYIDTFKDAGYVVDRLYGDVFKMKLKPEETPDFDNLVYFSEEESYLVNSLIDRLSPTNSLKKGLREKLAVIYDSTSIADFVDRKSNAAHVESLRIATRYRKTVILHDYESANSGTIRDRVVEPFGFTTDFIEVWAYDTEDGHNKLFKVNRIGEVEVTDLPWKSEASHRRQGMDVFRMSSRKPNNIKLQLSVRAKNLLIEEYPLAEKELVRDGNFWILDTKVFDYAGVCRFCAGLMGEVKIIDSPGLVEYLKGYLKRYYERL